MIAIYISGIAGATPAMRIYAKQAASKAVENGWALYIGSHPNGVDEALYAHCLERGLPFAICTLQQKIPEKETLEEYMRRSEPAIALTDMCMFVGASPAVERCIEYAKECLKTVYRVTFNGEKPSIEAWAPPKEVPFEQTTLF